MSVYWVVFYRNVENECERLVLGVFSSLEKAQARCDEYHWLNSEIEEWTIDTIMGYKPIKQKIN